LRRLAPINSAHNAEIILGFAENNPYNLRIICGD
jgi:hypothetical protein